MSSITGMSLAELIQSRAVGQDERLTATVSFYGIFDVTLANLTKERYATISKKAKKTIFVNHQKVEVDDEDKLAEMLAEHVVGWEGLTVRKVSRMFWLRIDDLTEDEREAAIPHSPEEAKTLLLRNKAFADFVLSNALNASNFSEALEGAEKNLPSGPASGPAPAE